VRPGRIIIITVRRVYAPGTMDVICTRKQKPGEISPGRVYISPENDNTPVHYVITVRYIMLYGRGPLADDPPPPLIAPRSRFSGALNNIQSAKTFSPFTGFVRAVGNISILYMYWLSTINRNSTVLRLCILIDLSV